MKIFIEDSDGGKTIEVPDNFESFEVKIPLSNGCHTTQRYEIRKMSDGTFVGVPV